LFVSSGTQSNLLAMLSHCGRGEEYLVGDQYHIYVDEAGGPAVLGSLVSCVLETNELGALAPEQIRNAIKEDDPHYAITRLLCLENTVGGVAQSVESLRQLTATAKEGGLLCHLDGARLMNAAVALGVEASKIADSFDSVCMCLSKGLGAPVGSVLSGSKDFINRARRNRKLVGGGMRQAGILAAAGLYALEHNIARLAQDHAKAAQLAESLADIEQLKVTQHTNMVFIELSIDDQISFLEHMAKHDILIGAPAPVARLVAHLDTTEADIEKVAIVVRKYFHH
jgi:threonine aldolase